MYVFLGIMIYGGLIMAGIIFGGMAMVFFGFLSFIFT
jgi:hypothetical protein